jgi:hypothetical protein
MGRMLAQLWLMLSTFFTAGERIAKTVDNLAKVGEEMSESYLEETRVERAAKIAKLRAENAKLIGIEEVKAA